MYGIMNGMMYGIMCGTMYCFCGSGRSLDIPGEISPDYTVCGNTAQEHIDHGSH
jgi:hypothetical protein